MFERLLEQIARGLDSRGIPYMVIGGQAVLLYGEPRLTRDIDITLGIGPERLTEVLDLQSRWGWQVLADSPAEFVQRTMVLPCQEPSSGIRVDFIFSLSAYEKQAISHVRRVHIGNVEVRFASVEDLIIHKIVAGRARDLEDVRSILLKNPNVDVVYLRRWLQEFDASLSEAFERRLEDLWKTGRHPKGSE